MGHLLFIDSPLNVGFSYHGNRTGKAQVNSTIIAVDHLINFLHHFFNDVNFVNLRNC
jgi:carboxypeptidase C (cathepsin A)